MSLDNLRKENVFLIAKGQKRGTKRPQTFSRVGVSHLLACRGGKSSLTNPEEKATTGFTEE